MKIKRKIAGILLIGMIFYSYPVFASTMTMSSDAVVEDSTSISVNDWNYTIYDEDGDIKSEGTFKSTSGLRINLVDDEITLENGETVVLMPNNGGSRGVYCKGGTTMDIIYKLNRKANLNVSVRGYSDNSGKYSRYINAKTYSDTYTAPHTDNYYAVLRNCSSDPVVLKSFYLIF